MRHDACPSAADSASRQVRSWMLARSPDELQGDHGVAAVRPGERRRTRCRPACPPARSGPATPVVLSAVRRPGQRAVRPAAIARAHSPGHHAVPLDHRLGHAQHRDLERRWRRRRPRRGRPSDAPGTVGDERPRAGRRSATRPWPAWRPRDEQVEGLGGGASARRARALRGARGYCSSHGAADRGLRRSSATGTPPRWSARTARSTGCACRASTPPPASPRCSATTSHGRWQLVPDRRLRGRRRRYVDNSAALETTFTTDDGRGHAARRDADRRRPGRRRPAGRPASRARVRMRHEWVVRFDYGQIRAVGAPPRRSSGEEVITAVAGPDKLVLRGPRLPIGRSTAATSTSSTSRRATS